jgi:hypothetical protein
MISILVLVVDVLIFSSKKATEQREFTVQEWAQWYANLLLVNEQREAGRDRSGDSVGPTRVVNHSAS